MGSTAAVQPLFTECPRCGGWARARLELQRNRRRCRGCGWTGFAQGRSTSLKRGVTVTGT